MKITPSLTSSFSASKSLLRGTGIVVRGDVQVDGDIRVLRHGDAPSGSGTLPNPGVYARGHRPVSTRLGRVAPPSRDNPAMSSREERMALNEAASREINEEIEQAHHG